VTTASRAAALQLRQQVRESIPEAQPLIEQFDRLLDVIEDLGSCVLALSGGIDSSFLLRVTSRILGGRCIAVTAESAALPAWDRADAQRAGLAAESHGAAWRVIATRELDDPRYVMNSPLRCYFCKAEVYGRLGEVAREEGLAHVIDGTNATDAGSTDRPGMAAAAALGVRSPLAECGLSKDDVRALARALGMSDWDRPASACLSSRIPHGVRITPTLLRRVEQTELGIRGLGFSQVRVRDFGDTARVEVDRPEVERLLASRAVVDLVVRSTGFTAWTAAEYVGRGAGEVGDVPG
jgi:uncharacterized protein